MVIEFSNVLICDMALLRKTILMDVSSVRLDLIPNGEKISVENIRCDDGFIDEFDLVNKVRMIRID